MKFKAQNKDLGEPALQTIQKAWQLAIAVKFYCEFFKIQEVIALPPGRVESCGLTPLTDNSAHATMVTSREDVVVACITEPLSRSHLTGFVLSLACMMISS